MVSVMCYLPCSDLETQLHDLKAEQQNQLGGLHREKDQLYHLLSNQGSTLASIQHSMFAVSRNSSQLWQKQQQLQENLQQLVTILEPSPGEQAGCARQEAEEEGRSQKGALLRLQGHSGLGTVLEKIKPSWPSGHRNNNKQ